VRLVIVAVNLNCPVTIDDRENDSPPCESVGLRSAMRITWKGLRLPVFPMDGDGWDQKNGNVQDFPNSDHASDVHVALTGIKAEEQLHEIRKNTAE
jgi:hypothetical protein